MDRHWLIQDNFFSAAQGLRRHFDRQFAKPSQTHQARFVWDYWHVPNQYSLLRTPAFHYFPKGLYQRWHRQLVQWGREVLGCHDISPPWLSCYIDGCEQELHADHPHGPWAFVFSLTPTKERGFSGGETCLLRPEVLRDWAHASGDSPTESDQLLAKIDPRFNRLVVFDPRLPHGVRRVQGTRDPRQGRLVMHGWFVQPRPFFTGPLRETQVQQVLGEGLERYGKSVADMSVAGYVSLRLQIGMNGRVSRVKPLTNTLVGMAPEVSRTHALLKRQIMTWRFPKARKGTHLTLPVRFGA
ncbi:MAG: 2OG-Fe(II) oxygenase [Bdellovibrionales bacterium]